jgi:hypothetical protein
LLEKAVAGLRGARGKIRNRTAFRFHLSRLRGEVGSLLRSG